MIVVATCLWDANEHSGEFSRDYGEHWVDKLYGGFKRNLKKRPFRFVCFTDRKRKFVNGVEQEMLLSRGPDGKLFYGCFNEPFRLNLPMILVGLDTVVVADVSKFADYCLTADIIALPRSPKFPERSINGVCLVPAGYAHVYYEWLADGARENDMDWLRRYPNAFVDKLFPGEIQSVKFGDINRRGLQHARIVYFHGSARPSTMSGKYWIQKHWRVP